MAVSKELITKIVLKAQADPSISKAFSAVSKDSDSCINKLSKIGDTAKRAFQIVATAAATGAVACAKAAIDFESAFAGVQKTVDETNTTSYEDLKDGIRALAKETPAAATEIADVAAAAGQLGIKADDILTFSKTMIDLGESTNLTSEEAATSIAKLFNVTGTSMDWVSNFGSTLVALGNNAATTESDILAMATRIAGTGSQIGLTEPQILALATSLSSVGIEAEAGGTAISTTMSQIDKAVALNSEELAIWAETAGMSVADFTDAWETDAYGALQDVIKGMAQTTDEGGNLNILLEDLGINGIRQGDSLKRLANASKLMGEMTELSNNAWAENSALSTEANTRYATMASRIQILKNKLTDVAITIGERLMPYLDTLMDKIDGINFEAVADKIVGAINWIAEHSETLMGVASVFAGWFVGIKIAGFIKGIISVIQIISALVKAFGFAKVALAALGGPVTIVISVIGALVAGFIYLWNNCEGFRNFWIGLWEKIKSAAVVVGNWLKNFFTVTIPNAFNAAVQWLSQLPKKIVSFFQELPYKFGYIIGLVIGKIILFGQKLLNFATVTVPQFIGKVIEWFKQLPSKVWTWLSNTIQKVVKWGGEMIPKAKKFASDTITAILNFFKELPSKMLEIGKNIVQGLWNGLKNAKQWLIDKVKSFGSGIVDGIKSALGINSPSVVMMKLAKYVPQGFGIGIEKNSKYAVNAVKSMGGKITSAASRISPTISTATKVQKFGTGGTVTSPQMAIVGDTNETIVPHGNTPRNRALLAEAARGVGASGGNVFNFTFAPVISGGNADENRAMIQDEEEAFERRMQAWIEKNRRLAFNV